MDLLNQLNLKNKELETSIKSLRQTGTNYAAAERDYKVLLSQKVLELRDEGMKVTIIPLVVYGLPEVAKKRFERDTAEAIYKANQEAINSIKLQIRIVEGQIDREWSAASRI